MSSNLNKLYIDGFPYSQRTPESDFGRRSYDLPKLEVMRSQL